MAGPSNPDGRGFYGAGYWGQRVFWEGTPSRQRDLDTEGYLENLMKVWGDEAETFLNQISQLPDQREPYKVRAEDGEIEWFYFTEAFNYKDSYWGDVVRLIGEKVYADMPDHDAANQPVSDQDELEKWYPWWPYKPISKVARWWKTRWNDDFDTLDSKVEFEVVRVRTRSFDWPTTPYRAGISKANEVWIKGGDLRIFFDYLSDASLVSWRDDDWQVVGEGDGTSSPAITLPHEPVRLWYNDTASPTPWLTADSKFRLMLRLTSAPTVDFELFDVPSAILTEKGNLYPESATPGQIDTSVSYGTINYQTGEVVLSVPSDTVDIGSDVKAKWYARGYYLGFFPPRMIDRLSRDFGLENDRNDPEDVQRSTIANITKFWGLKSSQKSYGIRGDISLFDVEARGMWRICDVSLWLGLASYHRFTYGGLLYTDIKPRYIRFDDISGDEEFFNPDTSPLVWETLVDNEAMYEDNISGDGFSIGLAYALDVTQGSWGEVSHAPVNTNRRGQAGVVASELLTDAESLMHGFEAGYRVTVRMLRCQEKAFNWRKGVFGITEYCNAKKEVYGASVEGAVPAVDDHVFWIDAVDQEWTKTVTGATLNEDVGEWKIIVGVGKDLSGAPNPGPPVGHADITGVVTGAGSGVFTISGDHTGAIHIGDVVNILRSSGNDGQYDVTGVLVNGTDTDITVGNTVSSTVVDGEMGWIDTAVRYWPAVSLRDCCYCRSYKMRMEMFATEEAYAFYDTENALDNAIERLQNKIAPPSDVGLTLRGSTLVPIHARVVDWAIGKRWILGGVNISAPLIEMVEDAFLSSSLGAITNVDVVRFEFTVAGDYTEVVYADDVVTVRDSTGNDGDYTVLKVKLVGGNTVVGVSGPIPSAVADGDLYPMPSKILMTVEQRGDMGAGQTMLMSLGDEAAVPKWTVTQGTGVSDPDTWYPVVIDLDVTSDIGNNKNVLLYALGVGPSMAYGDVRFKFLISKYKR